MTTMDGQAVDQRYGKRAFLLEYRQIRRGFRVVRVSKNGTLDRSLDNI